MWISDVFEGSGVAADSQQCSITLPLTTQPLRLLEMLRNHMENNFFPSVLTIAGAVFALHYHTFMAKLKSCLVVIAFGPSGAGKTMALQCSLALLGAADLRFFHGLSPARIIQLCSTTSIPLGVDDHDSKAGFRKVIMDWLGSAR